MHICDWCLHVANMHVGLPRQTPACSAQSCNISPEPCNHRLPRSLQTLHTNQHGKLSISTQVSLVTSDYTGQPLQFEIAYCAHLAAYETNQLACLQGHHSTSGTAGRGLVGGPLLAGMLKVAKLVAVPALHLREVAATTTLAVGSSTLLPSA